MADSNPSHLGGYEKENSDRGLSGIINRNNDYKILVPNVDQILKDDRIHLLLDMPGLDESSCEIELTPCRVSVYGKLHRFSTSDDCALSSAQNRGLLKRMRNEQARQFQYFFDIPVGFEGLNHAQFVEGTLHICVDRVAFKDMEEDLSQALN
tara:strand:- start:596 stop:1051 length:456 start_codon:yes stop_codon:yes gene_type:complete